MNGVLKIFKRFNVVSSYILYVGLSKFFIKKLVLRSCKWEIVCSVWNLIIYKILVKCLNDILIYRIIYELILGLI